MDKEILFLIFDFLFNIFAIISGVVIVFLGFKLMKNYEEHRGSIVTQKDKFKLEFNGLSQGTMFAIFGGGVIAHSVLIGQPSMESHIKSNNGFGVTTEETIRYKGSDKKENIDIEKAILKIKRSDSQMKDFIELDLAITDWIENRETSILGLNDLYLKANEVEKSEAIKLVLAAYLKR